ncbi:MAG: hypothetical protein ABL933_08615 [Methyloglobulus sp.]|nr:hypothetical protein [Methyloglobulus sp.]
MSQYCESNDPSVPIDGDKPISVLGKFASGLGILSKLWLVGILSLGAGSMVALAGNDMQIKPTLVDSKPILRLNVFGPTVGKVGKPIGTIKVALINPSMAMPNSRLRIFVHGQEDSEVRLQDINIEVKEKGIWKRIQVEPIDGGVLGAIGEEGTTHKERHKHGGFSIHDRTLKLWNLRVTFRLSGHYSMIFAVSPDNGQTQLAKPVSLSLEAL